MAWIFSAKTDLGDAVIDEGDEDGEEEEEKAEVKKEAKPEPEKKQKKAEMKTMPGDVTSDLCIGTKYYQGDKTSVWRAVSVRNVRGDDIDGP